MMQDLHTNWSGHRDKNIEEHPPGTPLYLILSWLSILALGFQSLVLLPRYRDGGKGFLEESVNAFDIPAIPSVMNFLVRPLDRGVGDVSYCIQPAKVGTRIGKQHISGGDEIIVKHLAFRMLCGLAPDDVIAGEGNRQTSIVPLVIMDARPFGLIFPRLYELEICSLPYDFKRRPRGLPLRAETFSDIDVQFGVWIEVLRAIIFFARE